MLNYRYKFTKDIDAGIYYHTDTVPRQRHKKQFQTNDEVTVASYSNDHISADGVPQLTAVSYMGSSEDGITWIDVELSNGDILTDIPSQFFREII
jgi:hypothetical protein